MIEWVMPQSAHWQMSFFFLVWQHACTHVRADAHTHMHRLTKSTTALHIEMIVSCLCQVVLFIFFSLSLSPAMETSSWEIEQFLIENSAGN